MHVLFSGTSLVSSNVGLGKGARDIPDPPDKGCIAMVLRTGFASSQGELIQLIEFSQQAVSADSKEVSGRICGQADCLGVPVGGLRCELTLCA